MAESEKGSCTSDLGVLLESGEGADVTFVAGESQLPAHSCILAARSPVFRAMLRSNMQEASSRHIQITEMREDVFRQVLSFIYTDTASELESMAAELLAAADKYDLPLLKKRCEEQMARDVSIENAAATAAVAVLHCCTGLKTTAFEFIASHPEVLATRGWAQLLQDNAEAAVEICKQVATAPTPPLQPLLPPKAVTKNTSTDLRSSESRVVPDGMKQDMASRLMEAARCGRAREVWALLTAGAPKDARDSSGNTALHLAVTSGNTATIKCLLDGGLDPNAVNSSRQTPLHFAAQRRETEIIWMLVAASACIDAQDDQGQTPLHVAAQLEKSYSQFVYLVNTLLLAGARKDIKDFSGRTPESVATVSTKEAFSTSCEPSSTCRPYYDLG